MEWRALGFRDKLSALRIGPVIRREQRWLSGRTKLRAVSVDETVESWLVRNGQTDRLREMLWTPLALAALNQAPADAAAEPFARVLAEMFGRDPRASAIALPRRPLEEMYAGPARRFIEERGGEVRTNAPARVARRTGPGGGCRATRRIDHHLGPGDLCGALVRPRRSLRPDSAIARGDRVERVPHRVEPHCHRQFVARSDRVANAIRRPPWPHAAVALRQVGDPGSPLITRVARLERRRGRRRVDERDARRPRACGRFARRSPRARDAIVRHATVVRERRATFSLAPGQPPRPATLTPVRGFFLAGDWTDTGLPGTIESAVVSGHRAALAALHP